MNDGQRPNVTTVPTANPSAGVASAFLTAGGEMAALISAKDWAATPLGAQDHVAAEPADRSAHPGDVALRDVARLGTAI